MSASRPRGDYADTLLLSLRRMAKPLRRGNNSTLIVVRR
jgi:hypothetical protein